MIYQTFFTSYSDDSEKRANKTITYFSYLAAIFEKDGQLTNKKT